VVDAGELGEVDVHLAGDGAAASISTWSRRCAAVEVAELLPRLPAGGSDLEVQELNS
jgi:hypothetical protein